uniref:Uncharacterized protein n=1 Tax=Oryza meridionalis TaxID=40149 RepID=A0A0E0FB45_9ORYZ
MPQCLSVGFGQVSEEYEPCMYSTHMHTSAVCTAVHVEANTQSTDTYDDRPRTSRRDPRTSSEIHLACIYKDIFQKQLSTRVGCGQVHRIIENDLDKCKVVVPNPPTKTDDISHSTGHA